MNCPRCNSQVPADSSFCPNCGFNLNGQNNMNNNTMNNNQQMMYPNQMQQGQGQKSKIGKTFKMMLIFDCFVIPLMLLQLSGGDLKLDSVITMVVFNLVAFSIDFRQRNNINKQ